MKVLHTADIHLNSPLVGTANPVQRRRELLQALDSMSEFANNSGVEAVIVAGDLFDDKFASEKTIIDVAHIIAQSHATWFVLRGNHGDATPYDKLKKLCPQVQTFGEDWKTYQQKGVAICGRELGNNDQEYWQKLSLPQDTYNILVLHGDVDEPNYGFIDKKAIANSGANYVALGHRHSFATHKFGKVVGCYCGVLEMRGFDEREQTGFVLLDTDANSVTFVKQAIRSVESVTVDFSAVQSDLALEKLLLESVAEVSPRNYLNVTLTGQVDVQLDLSVVESILQSRFFALRIQDKTQPKVDIDKLSKELSLRGEFVRQALALPQEDQAEVLKLGFALLNGGDLQ